MAFADRVKDTTTSIGTGTITLSGTAPTGFQSFATGLPANASVPYCIASQSSAEWEVGLGTLLTATTLSRSPTASSNAGALVNFGVGTKDVFATLTASQLTRFASSTDTVVNVIANAAVSTVLFEEGGVSKRISFNNMLAALGTAPTALAAAGPLSGLDVITLTQDGINEVKTTINALAAVINTINGTAPPPDTVAPSFVSAVVANASPTVITLTFNETLGAFTPATTAFTVSGGKSVTGINRTGATIALTCSAAYAFGDTITVSYVKPATNPIQDVAGNQTASFGPSAVTNNVAAPTEVVYTITRNGNGQPANTTTGVAVNRASANLGTFGGYIAFKASIGLSGEEVFWNFSPLPGISPFMGWGTSNTTPPPKITTGDNNSAENKTTTGHMRRSDPANSPAWTNNNIRMWVQDVPGVQNWYFWIDPDDGAALCVNANSPCVVTLS